jgi:hypothetical protein
MRGTTPAPPAWMEQTVALTCPSNSRLAAWLTWLVAVRRIRTDTPDHVSTSDLAALLRPARRRVKLAVVSTCESAADTTAQTLRLLGLTEQAEALEAARHRAAPSRPPPGPQTAISRSGLRGRI